MEERIANLEERLSWQEDAIEKMSGEILDLRVKLERQEAISRRLADRLKDLQSGDGGQSFDAASERPPHY